MVLASLFVKYNMSNFHIETAYCKRSMQLLERCSFLENETEK